MLSKGKIYLLSLCAIVLLVLANSLYIVSQAEQVIVLQFGEPMRDVQEPGLKMKVPFVQNLVYYDKRLLKLDPPSQSVVLSDKKRLEVDSFTRYKIVDPLQFYKTVRTELQARSKLEEIVNSSMRRVLGKIALMDLLSSKRTQIMKDISEAVKVDAKEIGVDVADVRIKRADLPVDVLQAINERMKAERQRDAKEARAKGQQEAQRIMAEADKEKVIIITEAQKNADILRGQGDNEAISIMTKAANTDPKFYSFYRSLEAYKEALAKEDTQLVLSPDAEFFEYFSKSLN